MLRKVKKHIPALLFITALAVFGLLAWPHEDKALRLVGMDSKLQIRRGLDLQGGAYLVYEADMEGVPEGEQKQALENVATVLKRRVDPGGTTEAVVQVASNNRVVVQYPGAQNVQHVIARLGRTAQLNFVEIPVSETGEQGFLPTGITGKDVQKATVNVLPQTNQVIVSLELKGGDSTRGFGEVTTRLSQSGGLLVTLLDQDVIFGPARVEPILNGQAQLTGNFTFSEAQEIANLLNAGALPVPVELVAQRTIGPTLGSLTVKQSVVAALIGLISVSLFLLIYYRLYGLVAVVALVFYTLMTLSVYKLSSLTPYAIVLSMAGIAGFILSVAVAVDANILILERIKEEYARGHSSIRSAMETGYRRASSSIRDANAATLIGSVILFKFGTPIIKGFAVTLGLGVILSLLTVVTASRLLLRLAARTRLGESRPRWFGLAKSGEKL